MLLGPLLANVYLLENLVGSRTNLKGLIHLKLIICETISVLFMNRYNYIVFLHSRYGAHGNASYVSKKCLYFSSPAFNIKLSYKIRFKIIFVQIGLGSGQQHFGKSNKIVWFLMSDYLFTSQFESILFSCKSKDRISFESLKKKKKNDPRPRRPKSRPLSHSVHGKLYMYCVPRH